MVWLAALTVRTTATLTVPAAVLAMLTAPVYVPGSRPVGSACTTTDAGVAGVAVPVEGEALSQATELSVDTDAVNGSDPPP